MLNYKDGWSRGRDLNPRPPIGSARLETLNYLQFDRFPRVELSSFGHFWGAVVTHLVAQFSALLTAGTPEWPRSARL